jgi:molybdopterin-containing oxidoreductase family iron-sulfur binding subunit
VARALAARVGVTGLSPQASLSDEAEQFVAAAAGDLKANAGACVVVAGESQPPAVHALAHALNQALGNVGNTVAYTETVEVEPVDLSESLRSLVAAIEAGQIHTLLIVGVNPVYTVPADIPFRGALEALTKGSNFTGHLGLYDDETAFYCQWHVPEAHYLESWGDVRAADGTASIVQPLIEPLYGGRSIHDLLSVILGETAVSSYETVRAYWRHWLGNQPVDFEEWWARALRRGVIEGTAAMPIQLGPAKIPPNRAEQMGSAMELVLRPDPCVGDGSFANLAWLQELPKPFTKLVWDNAALLSPRTAQRLGASDGDVLQLTIDGRSVDAAAMILPGLADDSVTVHLGYGRTRAGGVGTTGVGEWERRGFNAYALRNSRSPWGAQGLVVAKTGARWKLVTTRSHQGMAALKAVDHDKLAAERLKPDVVATPETARDEIDLRNRKLVRVVSLTQYRVNPNVVKELGGEEQKRPALSLYPGWDYSKGPQWGMSIDLQTCIGCNACVIACQAENNIATVGKEEVSRQREMHWIRIDSYFAGSVDRPRVYHQPVPCMHCENAPCEYVCPTGATTHSTQGLNEMTYNRCIGTRYCSNNCPYKVRRFNFFNYGYESSQGSTQLQKNPEVTVRTRGVMEKCTYCVQRINRTRIEVEKAIVDLSEQARRAANDDERKRLLEQARARRFEMFEGLQTACQQACPTRAVVFGDIREPRSQVAMLKAQPHDYTLLDELTTRPRTSYLARVLNPSNAKEGGAA